MSRYHINEIDEYPYGSSDRPFTGGKSAKTEEINRLYNISDALSSQKIINPKTSELDKNKTNDARLKYIEENTRQKTKYKNVIYLRRVYTDDEEYINVSFETEKNE